MAHGLLIPAEKCTTRVYIIYRVTCRISEVNMKNNSLHIIWHVKGFRGGNEPESVDSTIEFPNSHLGEHNICLFCAQYATMASHGHT